MIYLKENGSRNMKIKQKTKQSKFDAKPNPNATEISPTPFNKNKN